MSICSASIGTIGDANLSSVFSVYTNVISELVTESYENAQMNEMVSYEDMSGINIFTDARHDTRTNSMFSDVVCIGANTLPSVVSLINKFINASVSVMTMQPDMYNYSVIYTIQIMINS
jgi:hypothetical protein